MGITTNGATASSAQMKVLVFKYPSLFKVFDGFLQHFI